MTDAALTIFFSYIFGFFLCILCTSAAPQRPAHGTVSSQVATHHRTDRVCRVLGGAGFEPRTTDLQSGALPLDFLYSGGDGNHDVVGTFRHFGNFLSLQL